VTAPLSPLRVLIVDDEPLARQRIGDLLAPERGVEIIATADNGVAAVDAIRRLSPDLVFLDVQMPGMTGLDVVRTIGPSAMPPTIFVTAYDQHALQAFDLAALDYLVKPFDDERFEQAFHRARRYSALEDAGRLHEQLLTVLRGESVPAAAPASDEPPVPPSPYLSRIAIEARGKVKFLPVSDIDYIISSGPYAEVVAAGRKHLIREAMQTLEDRLDPSHFTRIHRSTIVRVDRIDTLHRGSGGDYDVQLQDGTRLRVSRSRRDALAARLGIR
jgi:two-component system, LytTR family, response regulator